MLKLHSLVLLTLTSLNLAIPRLTSSLKLSSLIMGQIRRMHSGFPIPNDPEAPLCIIQDLSKFTSKNDTSYLIEVTKNYPELPVAIVATSLALNLKDCPAAHWAALNSKDARILWYPATCKNENAGEKDKAICNMIAACELVNILEGKL